MGSEPSVLICQGCGEPLEPDWDRCPACQTPTGTGALTCANCGRSTKTHWKECPSCRTPLPGYATPTHPGGSAPRTGGERAAKADQAPLFLSIMDDSSAPGTAHGLDVPILEGDVLGESNRYTVRKKLGMGGFGSVYRVHDSILKEDFALKIVAAEGEGKAQRAVEQLLHEFKLRGRINDMTHVVKSEDPRPCDYKGLSLVLLPMELATDGNLRQWLGRNRDVEKRRIARLDLFKQTCLGVRAIHEAGLVHMDVKPENVLLCDGRAKVTDFGIGRFTGSGFENNPEQVLRQGVGTPQYMSPEQFQAARQKDISSASDLYSLGLVLYEILDGGLPFDGTRVELREKHLNMPPP